jgi:hypothetical protein
MSNRKMEDIIAAMEELEHGLVAVDEALASGHIEESREALRTFRHSVATCRTQLRSIEETKP